MTKQYKAVPVGELRNARGESVEMDPGDCLWCGEYVTSQRNAAGATNPLDPCWATEGGDYGCDASPETCEEGCGDHARPYDLARAILKP